MNRLAKIFGPFVAKITISDRSHNQTLKLPEMDKGTHSIAASEATTLVDEKPQAERTSLTGGPIKYEHDALSNVMLGDGGGFGAASVGANRLPFGYTDQSLVRIPIKMSDVDDVASSGNDVQHEKKGGLFSKFSSKRKEKNEEIVVVMMSRGDYLKYWAKDENGKFRDSVVEPSEGRKEWLRRQLELNEEMKRQDPSLGKGNPKNSYSKSGNVVTAALGAAS